MKVIDEATDLAKRLDEFLETSKASHGNVFIAIAILIGAQLNDRTPEDREAVLDSIVRTARLIAERTCTQSSSQQH